MLGVNFRHLGFTCLMNKMTEDLTPDIYAAQWPKSYRIKYRYNILPSFVHEGYQKSTQTAIHMDTNFVFFTKLKKAK